MKDRKPRMLAICDRCDKQLETTRVYIGKDDPSYRPNNWGWVRRQGTLQLLCPPCIKNQHKPSKKEVANLYRDIREQESCLKQMERMWNQMMREYCGDKEYRGTVQYGDKDRNILEIQRVGAKSLKVEL